METKFKAGDVVRHKASDLKLVILYPLKKFFFKIQRYSVRGYDAVREEYHEYICLETELRK